MRPPAPERPAGGGRRRWPAATMTTVVSGPSAGRPDARAGRADARPAGLAFYTPPAGAPAGTHGDLVSYRTTTVNLGAGVPGRQRLDRHVPVDRRQGRGQLRDRHRAGPHGPGHRHPAGPQLRLRHPRPGPAVRARCRWAPAPTTNANVVAALRRATPSSPPTTPATRPAGRRPTSSARPRATPCSTSSRPPRRCRTPGSAPAPVALWGSRRADRPRLGRRAGAHLRPERAAQGRGGRWHPRRPGRDRPVPRRQHRCHLRDARHHRPRQPVPRAADRRRAQPCGKAAFATLKTQCVFEALQTLVNKKLSDFTTGGLTLDQLLAIPQVSTYIDAQKVGTKKINVPLYDLRAGRRAGAAGPGLRRQAALLRPRHQGDLRAVPERAHHHPVPGGAQGPVVHRRSFRRQGGDRQLRPEHPAHSTAPPKGGDSLWHSTAGGCRQAAPATLNQDVTLPAGGTFSARANLTTKTLTGDLSVPVWDTPINVLGLLPLTPRSSCSPRARRHGRAAHRRQPQDPGTAKGTIVVKQLSLFGIPVTAGRVQDVDAVSIPPVVRRAGVGAGYEPAEPSPAPRPSRP